MASVISLNPGAASPLYLQLQRTLRSLIQQGEWPLGMRIPAVHELAERFQVHRLTVLKALAGLKRTGWVQTVQGRGSFVADHLPEAMALFPVPDFPYEGSALRVREDELGPWLGETLERAQNRQLVSFSAGFPPADLLPGEALRQTYAAIMKELGPAAWEYAPLAGHPDYLRGSGALAGLRGRAGAGRLGHAGRAGRPGGPGPGPGVPHRPGRPGAGGEPLLSGYPGPHPGPGPRGGARARGRQRHEPGPAGLGPAEGRRQAAHHRGHLPQPHRHDPTPGPGASASWPSPAPTACPWWRTTPTATCASTASPVPSFRHAPGRRPCPPPRQLLQVPGPGAAPGLRHRPGRPAASAWRPCRRSMASPCRPSPRRWWPGSSTAATSSGTWAGCAAPCGNAATPCWRPSTRTSPGNAEITEPKGGMHLWVVLPEELSALELLQTAICPGLRLRAGPPLLRRRPGHQLPPLELLHP